MQEDATRQAGRSRGPSPVVTVSRKEAVGIEIRRAIILGHLKPGDRLTECGLAASLGVSRPTLREALNQLTREGLIIAEPYRGMKVAVVSLDQIMEIAVTRQALDMLAVDAILADSTGDKLAAVERGWRRFDDAAKDPDPVVQHDAHVAFHREIWEASGNYLLTKLWPATEAQIIIALAEDQWTRADADRARRVHAGLMTAMHTHDRAAIAEAFRAHTVDSARELVSLLSGEQVDGGSVSMGHPVNGQEQ